MLNGSLPHLLPHQSRHSFATTLVRASADLATMPDLLGHSDLTVTSRYLTAMPQRQEAVATLPGPQEA